jgi:hypothetical protein
MNKIFTLLMLLALPSVLMAQRIDFDMSGRQSSEVTQTGYTSWVVATGTSSSLSVDSLTLTLQLVSPSEGACIKSNWWKTNVTGGSKLTGDGIGVYGYDADGNTPTLTEGSATVTLTIDGLSAGEHSLLAYHNVTDGLTGAVAPIDVSVDGTKQLDGVEQTIRAEKPSDSGQSYITFTATEGQSVVISYTTEPQSGVTYVMTGLFINALVFDEPNPKTTAVNPYPDNEDMHADCDDGSITLTWEAATSAVKHHVFIGTSADNLTEVTVTTDTSYVLSNPSNLNTYYWRVDEEDESGIVYTGEIWTFRPRHLAFPGAEGYGKYAIGGRGGEVYHVTSLEDDPTNPQPGTFRYGITQLSGPRTIVFDVGGVITLQARLTCSDPYVTIAGQTAPGQGIMFRGCPFGMASDGITRFLRMRLGHKELVSGIISDEEVSTGLDGMGMAGNDNSIMDHCSISWTIDEAFSSRGAKNLTLQHTLISEALNVAGHPNYSAGTAHGYAATIGGGENSSTLKVGSYHHNLLAHCEGRNWSISGGLDGGGAYDGHHDIFNNVVYNWGGRATDGGSHEINFVNNYYKMGPATTQTLLFRLQLEGTGSGTQSAYVNGNIRQAVDNGDLTEDELGNTYQYEASNNQVVDWTPLVSEPFFESLATIEDTKTAYKHVLSDVGCNMPVMDNHDKRMVEETLQGTTSTVGSRSGKAGLIDSEEDSGCEGFSGLDVYEASRESNWDSDSDGIPDWFEEAKGWDSTVANNNNDEDGDGYTDLEDYLNWMAEPHIIVDKQTGDTTVNLQTYFASYTNPTLEISPDDGILSIDDVNLVFNTGDINGFYDVDVTARDDDDIPMTRTIHLYVGEVASSINYVEADGQSESETNYYDLLGRKVGKDYQGIVISKGRKVIR